MNQLGNETSPYLLQHADNPIWWYAWGEEAFKVADKEQKPIFLSIGYSTCYWCHFMEKDSFEQDDVAAILNEHFIAIKVDREERPDVDQIYMSSLVAMRGQGGWPISMFLLPDGTPFFGASTIPHDKFIDLLTTIQLQWNADHGQFLSNSAIIRDQLTSMMTIQSKTDLDTTSLFKKLSVDTKSSFDTAYKGFGSGTKFPNPHQYHILLRRYLQEQDPEILRIVTESLDAMAKGGIHDHIDGGFHRYSVDAQWNIPHFEKMLYDQAGLIAIYLETYHLTQQPHYKEIAEKTLDFCIKKMRQENGGFISAFDAGELHKEGEYYAWTDDEIQMALSKNDLAYFYTKMDMAPIEKGKPELAIRIKQNVKAADFYADKKIKSVIKNLGFFRNERPVPHKDDKIITAWNGMMVHSLAKAYQITENVMYLEMAQETALFLKQHLTGSNQQLYRSWRDHTVSAEGTVDDYAFLIQGLLTLYESDGDPIWYSWAKELQDVQNKLFLDHENGGYFMDNGQDTTLFTRPKEFTDMAMSSGNSVSALNLLRFSHYGEQGYKEIASSIFNTVADTINLQPNMYSYMALAIDFSENNTKELVVVGSNSDIQMAIKQIHSSFRPYLVTAYSTGNPSKDGAPILIEKGLENNQTTYYLCENGSCKAPTNDLSSILAQL